MVNQDIGRHRTEIGQDNKQDVYNAIHNLMNGSSDVKPKVRLEDIWNYLDKNTIQHNKETKGTMIGLYEVGSKKWTSQDALNKAIEMSKKVTISPRTIQRCIANDERIKKEGWFFYIDDEARFERRYLSPSFEGRSLYKEFRDKMLSHSPPSYGSNNIDNKAIKRMVTEMGFFMVYSLIEACRPFRDKSLSLDERGDLVRYWIQNFIPIMPMLIDFLEYFKPDYFPPLEQMMADIRNPNKREVGLRKEKERKEKGLSELEIDEITIQKVESTLEYEYPLQFKVIEDCIFTGKTMTPFAYKDGNLIHPSKKVKEKEITKEKVKVKKKKPKAKANTKKDALLS